LISFDAGQRYWAKGVMALCKVNAYQNALIKVVPQEFNACPFDKGRRLFIFGTNRFPVITADAQEIAEKTPNNFKF
jgi:hypothetical protein